MTSFKVSVEYCLVVWIVRVVSIAPEIQPLSAEFLEIVETFLRVLVHISVQLASTLFEVVSFLPCDT